MYNRQLELELVAIFRLLLGYHEAFDDALLDQVGEVKLGLEETLPHGILLIVDPEDQFERLGIELLSFALWCTLFAGSGAANLLAPRCLD